MTLPSSAEIVIVGGGVMGASTAYHLAARGMQRVVLLERDLLFGQGATGRCAGGVRYQFATDVNIRLSLASLPMIERFADEIGQAVDYRKCGYLFVLTREDDVRSFERNVELQQSLGVDTQWLTGAQVRARVPQMRFDDALAGTLHDRDGIVDPNSVVNGYVNAARRLGAKAITECEVTGIRVSGGSIEGVETSRGTIATRTVVNAAGPWAARIGKLAGIDLPIVPIRRQMFTTTPLPELAGDFPFVIDFAQSLYFHREGDGLLIGMSNQREKPGFDQRVDEEFELLNLETAMSRLPMLENAGLASHWAGLYEVTPDAHPIFGSTPVDGLYVVAGFSGHGFMHGPIAGKLISELLVDGAYSSVDVSALDLWRFEEGRLIREYNVV